MLGFFSQVPFAITTKKLGSNVPLNGFPGGSVVKDSPALQEPQETWVPSLASGRSPGGGHGNPLPVFLPGESHGQRSLMGYLPWGHRVGHGGSDSAGTPTLAFRLASNVTGNASVSMVNRMKSISNEGVRQTHRLRKRKGRTWPQFSP